MHVPCKKGTQKKHTYSSLCPLPLRTQKPYKIIMQPCGSHCNSSEDESQHAIPKKIISVQKLLRAIDHRVVKSAPVCMCMWVLCLQGPVGGAGVWLKASRTSQGWISEDTGKENEKQQEKKNEKEKGNTLSPNSVLRHQMQYDRLCVTQHQHECMKHISLHFERNDWFTATPHIKAVQKKRKEAVIFFFFF